MGKPIFAIEKPCLGCPGKLSNIKGHHVLHGTEQKTATTWLETLSLTLPKMLGFYLRKKF
jgi:hypothetical protein